MTTTWRPVTTFYPSPRQAMQAPPEELAYVVVLNPNGNGRHDALAVLDVDPRSSTYNRVVGRVDMPNAGDEVHHFGWNACSAALCPYAPHPHMERRYLLVPVLRSSRIHVIDTKPDPARPKIVKVIEAEELHEVTGYSRPHTFHCGPDGIYVSALGAPDGNGPGGVFVMDHDTFEPLGRWEVYLVVVGLVGVKLLGSLPRSTSRALYGLDAIHELLEDHRVVGVRRRGHHEERDALPVDHNVTLRARFLLYPSDSGRFFDPPFGRDYCRVQTRP